MINNLSEHPQFSEKWDVYSKKFNALAEAMGSKGMDASMLKEVVMAKDDIKELDNKRFYKLGYLKGVEVTLKSVKKDSN